MIAEVLFSGSPLALAILALAALVLVMMVFALARRVWIAVDDAIDRQVIHPMATALDLAMERGAPAVDRPRVKTLRERRLYEAQLLQRLEGADDSRRTQIIDWLRDHGSIDRWHRQLREKGSRRRAEAAELLRQVRAPESITPLMAALGDEDLDIRLRAARALSELGGQQAREALIAALGDDSRWSVMRVADILSRMGPEVVQDLLRAFPQLTQRSRLAALDVIIRIGSDNTQEFLLKCLADPDRDIRARAASGLGRLGRREAAPALLQSMADTEWPVRAKAARALGDIGASEALSTLRAALADPAWWVRSNSAEALRRLGKPGIDILFEVLDGSDRFARDQALAILQGSGELERQLRPLVADPGTTGAGELGPALHVLDSLRRHQSPETMASLAEGFFDLRLRGLLRPGGDA